MEANNLLVDQAIEEGYKPCNLPRLKKSRLRKTRPDCPGLPVPPSTKKAARRPNKATVESSPAESVGAVREGKGPVDPVAGEYYVGYWRQSDSFNIVLVLPTADLGDRRIPVSIKTTGHLKDVPYCYHYSTSEGKILGWKSDFKDGGRLVHKRQFPVIYFDHRPFPEESGIGWLLAEDLSPLIQIVQTPTKFLILSLRWSIWRDNRRQPWLRVGETQSQRLTVGTLTWPK